MISITIRSMLILMVQSVIALLTIGFLVSWWWVLAIWGGSAVIGIVAAVCSAWTPGSHNNGYLPDVGDIAEED